MGSRMVQGAGRGGAGRGGVGGVPVQLFGRGRPCVLRDKFRQSVSHMFSKLPQIQFFDSVLDLPVVHRRRGTHSVTVQKTDEIPQVLLLDMFDDIRCCSTTGAGS